MDPEPCTTHDTHRAGGTGGVMGTNWCLSLTGVMGTDWSPSQTCVIDTARTSHRVKPKRHMGLVGLVVLWTQTGVMGTDLCL